MINSQREKQDYHIYSWSDGLKGIVIKYKKPDPTYILFKWIYLNNDYYLDCTRFHRYPACFGEYVILPAVGKFKIRINWFNSK